MNDGRFVLLCHRTLACGNTFRNFTFATNVSWQNRNEWVTFRRECVHYAATEQKHSSPVHRSQRRLIVIVLDTVDSPVDTRRRHASSTRRLLRILSGCGEIAHRNANDVNVWMTRPTTKSNKWTSHVRAANGRILNGEHSIQFSRNEPPLDSDNHTCIMYNFQFLITISCVAHRIYREMFHQCCYQLRFCLMLYRSNS